jgi:hypothetical protein
MLAKLVDGQLVVEPKKVVIANPEESLLKTYLGFKDYEDDNVPDYDPEVQYVEVTYEDTETKVIKHYTIKDIPQTVEV